MKADSVKFRGTIIDAFPGARFKVVLETEHQLDCIISGKIRKNNIKILKGDEVEVELSPYDLSLGRIVYRY